MAEADIQRQVCEAQENWRQKWHENGDNEIPFVTLTYAQSIDGSLAVERGKPTLLSGPASMKMTHVLRTLHNGIMVGVGTVIADNPSLNARLAEGSNPQPIIIDTHLICPTTIKLFTMSTCEKPIILFGCGSQDSAILERKRTLDALGARVFECNTVLGGDGRVHVDLRDAFRVVKQNGISSIMVEGGSAILTSCLQEATQRHFIDLVVVTVAPTFVGGLRAVGSLLTPSTAAATTPFPRLMHPRYHVLEKDLVILGQLG
ncbi:RibD C-terminal domain [Phytophthora infestans]|uniref:RibD C-terminal domain n=1 Tax=Phytophthora infestans TaxID=4787 RepID=A0A833T582_PHYIN|nr:RibD C-terminal domain [Phytophthora infestans]KAF4131219.1 RibD C-terminal domain [Phytophthora infestans]